MRFAQRKTTSTAQEYALDRWKVTMNSTGVTNTHSQHALTSSDTGPWEAGFRKSLQIALSGAGTVSAATGLTFMQSIEAQDVAHSGWDYTSTSSYITLGFWFKASTNQTFYAYFESQDGTKQRYPFSFTASGNDTWTKITKTIPGNSNLQFDNDNGAGLRIYFEIFRGTNGSSSGVSLDTWAASGSENIPDYATTWFTAGASTMEFTGIQLTATNFCPDYPHVSYRDELARCQRYYQTAPADTLMVYNSNTASWLFPVAMRSAASMGFISLSGSGAALAATANGFRQSSSNSQTSGIGYTASAEF